MTNIADKLNNIPIFVAIRRGLIMTIPFMVLGSFAVFINNLPIPAYQQFMTTLFGNGWRSFGGYIHQATFAIMAVIMNLAISYSMAKDDNSRNGYEAHPFTGAIVSLSSFFALIHVTGGAITMDRIGAFGVFLSIVSALIASKLFVFAHRFKRLQLEIYSNASETHFSQLMKSFVPAVLTITVFVFARLILESAFGIYDIHAFIYDGLRNLFTNMPTAHAASFIFVIFTHLLWFIGIHGSNVLDSVAQSVFVPALYENQTLIAYGLEPVNILTKQFFDVFVYMGGAGTTLSLIAAVLIGARRSITRQVSKISLLPGLINVNEMIIFGIPIVFNFYLLIPFVFIPLVLTFISYLVIFTGLVPMTIATVEWTTPIIMGGYIATGGSVAGSVLQIFNLVVATLLYLPFIKLYEKSLDRSSVRRLDSLASEVLRVGESHLSALMERQDELGAMARELAIELQSDFRLNRLYVNLQPQVNADGDIFGAEVLTRWQHKHLGSVPPYVISALAKESKIINELGYWIFEQAALSLRALIDAGFENITVSVNISPVQLDNSALAGEFAKIAAKYNVPPVRLEMEITEQTILSGINRGNMIKELQALGFVIAIDNLNHGSLKYMEDLNLSSIKIDGSLVKEMITDPLCSAIISSIINNANSTRVTALHVETNEQRDLLHKLGCTCYQGYLYNPALPLEKFINYCGTQKENING